MYNTVSGTLMSMYHCRIPNAFNYINKYGLGTINHATSKVSFIKRSFSLKRTIRKNTTMPQTYLALEVTFTAATQFITTARVNSRAATGN